MKNKQDVVESSPPEPQVSMIEPIPPSPKIAKGRNKRPGRKKQPVAELMKSAISEEPESMNLTEAKTGTASQANIQAKL